MKKLIAAFVLALCVSAFPITFTLEDVEVLQGYGNNVQHMFVSHEPFTVDVQDSATIQIRIEASYQFHGIGFFQESAGRHNSFIRNII